MPEPEANADEPSYPSTPVAFRGGPFRPGERPVGRTKGTPNKLTLQQRQVAEMVLGKPGTPEFEEFVASQRMQALAGILAPAILQLWLFYLLGKPVERIEVKDTTDEFEGVTVEQLRERAKVIAQRVVDKDEATDVH